MFAVLLGIAGMGFIWCCAFGLKLGLAVLLWWLLVLPGQGAASGAGCGGVRQKLLQSPNASFTAHWPLKGKKQSS